MAVPFAAVLIIPLVTTLLAHHLSPSVPVKLMNYIQAHSMQQQVG